MSIRVSLCTPLYNGRAHFAATVDSVISQTMTDWEWVIVDDGSTDGAVEIAEALRDDRIRIVKHEANRGAGPTWNEVVRSTTSALVKLVPQDDVLLPDVLEHQAESLETHEGVAIAAGPRQIIDGEGRVRIARRGPGWSGELAAVEVIRSVVRTGTNLIGEPAAVMFRRADFDLVGGFDEELAYTIDVDLWLRLLEHGDLWFHDEVVAAFRVSPSQWSVRLRDDQSAEMRRLLRGCTGRHPDVVSRNDRIAGAARAELNQVARKVWYAADALRSRWSARPQA